MIVTVKVIVKIGQQKPKILQ